MYHRDNRTAGKHGQNTTAGALHNNKITHTETQIGDIQEGPEAYKSITFTQNK